MEVKKMFEKAGDSVYQFVALASLLILLLNG